MASGLLALVTVGGGLPALLTGCAAVGGVEAANRENTAQRFEYATVAMGSRVRIAGYADPDADTEIEASVRRAFGVIADSETALSDYNPRSEARRLVERPVGAWTEIGPILAEALARSFEAHGASGGAFDVTIGPVTALWRDSAEWSREPTEAEIEDARARVGMHLIELDASAGRARVLRDGMRLDFGAIGKGLGADLALASLRADGIEAAMVEIGGDLVVGAPPPGAAGWVIEVSDGENAGATLVLANEAVATSGDAYRFTLVEGERASHVIEPATADPAPGQRAVTVVASSGWVADAVATVARLRGADAARAMGERLGGVRVLEPVPNPG